MYGPTIIICLCLRRQKIHLSQKVEIPFGEYMDGTYGEFSVQVEVNDEFVGRILQMGAGLEIVSPQNVREKFIRRVEALADLYPSSG